MEKKCNYNTEASKKNLKKIKEIRESGKLSNLDSIESCSFEETVAKSIPMPIWQPKKVLSRITVSDLPNIPTSKIIGTFDATNVIIDGGRP